jgi:hypothetical protein
LCVLGSPCGLVARSPNAKLTDDEERAKDGRIGTLGSPRSSSFQSLVRCYDIHSNLLHTNSQPVSPK